MRPSATIIIHNGRFKGLPTVAECTSCHDPNGTGNDADPNVARRKPMLDKFKDTDKPWGSYAKQPDLVYFSHKVVMTAKYEDGRMKARCGSCHGDKADSTNAAMLSRARCSWASARTAIPR